MNSHPTDDTLESDYDVVVVGARAAGASLAMLLARRGLRVLAVDRSAYGSDTLSTHSLARSAVLLLSRWGVLDRIRDADTPVTTHLAFHYGEEPMDIAISPSGDVDGLYSPRRSVLDAALVDAAVASGATIRHEVSVRGLTTDATGRVDGVELRHAGGRQRVRARWVVGADGTGSRVAAQVGAPVLHQESHTSAVIYTFVAGLERHRITNRFDEPGRAFGIIPTNDGLANVWAAMRPEEFAATARGDLQGAFERTVAASPAMAHALAGCERVEGFRGFPGLPGYRRQAFGPGWALVGDAGYFKDPVSAHGITDAFVGAELLADALDGAIAEPATSATHLARYQQQRDLLAAPLQAPVAALATMDLAGGAAAEAFLHLNEALRAEWKHLRTDGFPRTDRALVAAR